MSGVPARVAIGFASALAAPEAACSLLRAGFDVVAFARRGVRSPLRRMPGVTLVEVTAPEHDANAAVNELTEHLGRLRPDVVMPLDDAAIWTVARADAGAAAVAGAAGSGAELALDKRLQLAAAADAGYDVPATGSYDAPEAALESGDYPLVIKSALAVFEKDGRLCRPAAAVCIDRAELERAVRRLPAELPVLVQPYLTGTGEGLFGLFEGGNVHAPSAHRRIRMTNPQGSGSSACVSIRADEDLVAAAGRMLDAAGWRGLFMVELLRTADGRAWFMELNGRPWGSLALARRAGLEYPAWAVQALLGDAPQIPATAPPDGLVCRNLGLELVHLLTVLRGAPSDALKAWPSRWGTVRAVARIRRSDRWYNLESGTGSIFVEDAARTVGAALMRGVRRG